MDIGYLDVTVTLNTIDVWGASDSALFMLSNKYRPDLGENVECMLR